MIKHTKYIVLLGDGMADHANERGSTPLSEAVKPCIDELCARGELGLARTVPRGLKPGSDVANLSVMGYDPAQCYTGRSPLEAANLGIELGERDLAIRCNLVTLSGAACDPATVMRDYSAGEISTQEAAELIEALRREVFAHVDGAEIYCGTSYRHCLVLRNACIGTELTPPHDISGKPIAPHLPRGKSAELLMRLTARCAEVLASHPVNAKRIAAGQNPANSVWFWGEGTRPSLPSFSAKTGVSGAVISAVDLIKGIARLAGMTVFASDRFTGGLDTDYSLKAATALEALKTHDFVFIHVEAPDECGHRAEWQNKIRAIEDIDRLIAAPIVKALNDSGTHYRILIMPDHATPCKLMTHTDEPIPYILFDSNDKSAAAPRAYTEAAAQGGKLEPCAHNLIKRLIV